VLQASEQSIFLLASGGKKPYIKFTKGNELQLSGYDNKIPDI
jgi:hypothetical protein